MKRKLIATAFASIVTINIFASPSADINPTLVNVPQCIDGFFFGGTALYLKPSFTDGDLDYASVNFLVSKIADIEPGYDWGWGIHAGYIFPNTANDVSINYFEFSDDGKDSVSVPFFNTGGISTFNVNVLPIFNNFASLLNSVFASENLPISAAAKAKHDLNQVDLTVGQYINVGCHTTLHPLAGIRWLDIDREIKSLFFVNDLDVAPNFAFISEKSTTKGFGPMLGFDADYDVGLGFGATGHFDSALIVNDADVDTHILILNTSTVIPIEALSFNRESERQIATILDAKLGIDYNYTFCNSNLKLEAGWQVSQYRHVINRLHTFASGINPVTTEITGETNSNYNLSGPYFSATLHV